MEKKSGAGDSEESNPLVFRAKTSHPLKLSRVACVNILQLCEDDGTDLIACNIMDETEKDV